MEQKYSKEGISRRQVLKGLGMSAFAVPFLRLADLNSMFSNSLVQTVSAKQMKITKVESIHFNEKLKIGGGSGGSGSTEFCWIRIHTDSGIIGIGETYPSVNGELGSLKDLAAEYLIGEDPRDIEKILKGIYKYQSMRNSGGSEMHMMSAIDMALLDILGKSTGLPVYRLLGGRTRSKIKVYNTTTDYWAINNTRMGADTEKIVTFLLDKGITAMKIYPFRSEGNFISSAGIDSGVEWLRQIERNCREKDGNSD